MIPRPNLIPALIVLLATASLPAGLAMAQPLTTKMLNARAANALPDNTAAGVAQPSAAITSPTAGYVMAAPADPAEAMSRYLRILATSPLNLDALTGAGVSALAIGDANAAVSFFARAEQIAPRNGRIKAGLASGLVQLEQPKTGTPSATALSNNLIAGLRVTCWAIRARRNRITRSRCAGGRMTK
jgi:hypothetical protein